MRYKMQYVVYYTLCSASTSSKLLHFNKLFQLIEGLLADPFHVHNFFWGGEATVGFAVGAAVGFAVGFAVAFVVGCGIGVAFIKDKMEDSSSSAGMIV